MENQKRKRKWRYFVAGGLLLLAGSCCLHIELPYRGTIKDAETGEPLSEVVALLELDQTCILPPNPGGPSSRFQGLVERVSNRRGVFWFPLKVYVRPPLLCSSDRTFRFFKPGFFPAIASKRSGEVPLYRMTHHLNYLVYRDPKMEYELFYTEGLRRSVLYKEAVEKMKRIEVQARAADEYGVFFRLGGRQFTQIHIRKKQSEKDFGSELYYVRDESSREWFTIDSRGTQVELKNKNVPQSDFVSFHRSHGWPIFATRDSIFYPIEENPIHFGLKYRKREIKYIAPIKGGVKVRQVPEEDCDT